MSDEAHLDISALTVAFGGITALDDVSFRVAPHTICGLIGPNGAGKTTCFNCISGLYRPRRGRISFRGQDLLGLRRHDIALRGIGRTFQNLALFPSMTVRSNVLVGGHARAHGGFLAHMARTPAVRRAEQALEARVEQLLARFGLEGVADTPIEALNFATQKRVELARALAGEPSLLILDEPAAGLNHEEVGQLADEIRALRDRDGLTVLLVEHHMNLVMQVSDQVVVLNFGRKIAEGTPQVVQQDAAVISAYLGVKS